MSISAASGTTSLLDQWAAQRDSRQYVTPAVRTASPSQTSAPDVHHHQPSQALERYFSQTTAQTSGSTLLAASCTIA